MILIIQILLYMTKIIIDEWQKGCYWLDHKIRETFEHYGSDANVLLVYGDPIFTVTTSEGKTFPYENVDNKYGLNDLLHVMSTTNKKHMKQTYNLFLSSLDMYKKVFNVFDYCHYSETEIIEEWNK